MSKILITYIVTPETKDIFFRTLAVQNQFPGAIDGVQTLAVVNAHIEGLPMPQVISPRLSSARNFCLAAGLNAAMERAVQLGVDWLLLFDADHVLAALPTEFPPTGYGACRTYHTREGEEIDVRGITQWDGAGPLMLARLVFSRHRYCEDFAGYGYEDTDFHENVLAAAGITQSHNNAKAIHLWHAPRPTRRAISNFDLFMNRKAKTITLIACNRPKYTQQVVDALRRARGIENYKLYCGIEPGFPEVEDICRAIDFTHNEVIVNPLRLGVNYNNRHIIEHAFAHGSGFNVVVEDDIVLSQDALELCEWFYRHENRDAFVLMNLFSGDVPNHAPLRVYQGRHFCPWGWCVTKAKYAEWIHPHWMCDPRGWDFSINSILERNPHLRVLAPYLSRCRNIGREQGAHETPEHHDHVFANAVESDGSAGAEFELEPEPPVTYCEIADRVEAVKGWLEPEQAKWLFETVKGLSADAFILEVGSYLGKSTLAMAYACRGTRRKIACIDTWEGNDSDFTERDYFHIWKHNLVQNRLMSHVRPITGCSRNVLNREALGNQNPDLVFIDGSHQYEDVLEDFVRVIAMATPGAWIAIHDVHPSWPGPERVWREIASKQLVDTGRVSSLAFGRKAT